MCHLPTALMHFVPYFSQNKVQNAQIKGSFPKINSSIKVKKTPDFLRNQVFFQLFGQIDFPVNCPLVGTLYLILTNIRYRVNGTVRRRHIAKPWVPQVAWTCSQVRTWQRPYGDVYRVGKEWRHDQKCTL